MESARYLRVLSYLPELFLKKERMPNYFVFFVTHRCVAFCDHCFDWERRERIGEDDELTLEEIEKVSRSMGRILFTFLTGGDIFLREDIAEIAKIFYRNNGVQKFQMPSNGYFTDRIVSRLRDMAESCPKAHFGIGISIDGIGAEHDRIRHLPGLFDRAMRTLEEVTELTRHYPNIGINAVMCVSERNQATAVDTYRYLTEKAGVETVFFSVVRGRPRVPDCKEVDPGMYEVLCREIDGQMTRDMGKKGIKGFPFARLVNWKNMIKQRIIADIMKNDRYVLPCVAGSSYGILYANGDVYPCEMTDHRMGNVREAGYDLRKIWLAEENRKWVDSNIRQKRCYCTHECAMSASLLFNPLWLAKIIALGSAEEVKQWLLKKTAWLRGAS